uniref:Protein kinase domain-containing protein n=2 Tax=Oryza brachyantha TaxID=4533 RepID=J3KZJ4_ORYBR
MLVYEYMPKKSLDSSIFGAGEKLSWYVRRRIIEGIAQGILYIHEQSNMCVIHRDLKPSNILLDNEMNPKISDFGIARICTSNMTESNTTTVIGTIGYMAPEYFSHRTYSAKSDIFSFGVLVLEIISGKVAFGSYQIDGRSHDLRRYAWQLWKDEKCEELVDPSLSEENEGMDIIRCTQVALLCVQERAEDRPTMREVNVMLNSNNMTLSLPTKPGCHDTAPDTSGASQPTDMSITLPR